MRHKTFTALLLSIVLIVVTGCGAASSNEDNIFQYRNSYVGDNSAVNAIAQHLPAPNGEQLSNIELQTTTEPYGVTLNYELQEQQSDVEPGEDYKKVAITSSAIMLALVQNADYVTLSYVHDQFTVTKDDMNLWLGKPLNTFVSELQLTSYMEFYLEDENKIKQLVN